MHIYPYKRFYSLYAPVPDYYNVIKQSRASNTGYCKTHYKKVRSAFSGLVLRLRDGANVTFVIST